MTRIDFRLDRIPNPDERSRNYSVYAAAPSREIISRVWLTHGYLDQGQEGACTGFAVTNGLLAEPHMGSLDVFTNEFAREKIYYEAQKVDRFPGGEYPGAKPRMGGTGVVDSVKQAHKQGYIESYRSSFSFNEFLVGLSYYGPAVIGVNWYEGMYNTDHHGMIKISGRVSGGHSVLVCGVNIHSQVFRIKNSWGKLWGVDGLCLISFSDMERLLKEDGEAIFMVKR